MATDLKRKEEWTKALERAGLEMVAAALNDAVTAHGTYVLHGPAYASCTVEFAQDWIDEQRRIKSASDRRMRCITISAAIAAAIAAVTGVVSVWQNFQTTLSEQSVDAKAPSEKNSPAPHASD